MPRAKRSASPASDASGAIVVARAPKRRRAREDDARDDAPALDGAISLRSGGTEEKRRADAHERARGADHGADEGTRAAG